MKQLNARELDSATGGYKTEGRPASYNIEDRRPGAPPQWLQTVNTWWHNVKTGRLY